MWELQNVVEISPRVDRRRAVSHTRCHQQSGLTWIFYFLSRKPPIVSLKLHTHTHFGGILNRKDDDFGSREVSLGRMMISFMIKSECLGQAFSGPQESWKDGGGEEQI